MATYLNQDDNKMRDVLSTAKTIAVVGHSDKSHRTSYQIADYLRAVGYTVYPVNPTVSEIDGETSYATLDDIPVPIDIVNVFRRSEHLSDIVDSAIAVDAKAIWTQLGVDDPTARDTALGADIDIATNRCIKVEHMRLGIQTT